MRLHPIYERLFSHLRLSESSIPYRTAGFSRHGETPVRRRMPVLTAWLIGCLLTFPTAATAQGVCDRTPAGAGPPVGGSRGLLLRKTPAQSTWPR